MINFFYGLSPLYQALIASLLTFSVTTLGSACVFLFKDVKKNIMDILLGISAGIMLSAGIFSLLLPSIEQSKNIGLTPWLVVSLTIIFGSLFLIIGDKITNNFIKNEKNKYKRVLLLIVSIVLHNIPEGAAIGVAFGSVKYGLDGATIAAAISLSIGIGIQNFPEGSAVSLPLRREGLSRLKSFIIGALSGIVEPISALLGCLLVLKVKLILPFLLAFAAGAMIYVVIEELIPESQNSSNKTLISFLTLLGFVFMMILEII